MPTDERSNDLMHWQTTLVVRNTEAIAQRLRVGKVSYVSPGVVTFPEGTLEFKEGLVMRDPDGHAMR